MTSYKKRALTSIVGITTNVQMVKQDRHTSDHKLKELIIGLWVGIIKVENSRLFIFIFLFYFILFSNLELGVGIISYMTVTNYHMSQNDVKSSRIVMLYYMLTV